MKGNSEQLDLFLESSAEFSLCRIWRYSLIRRWKSGSRLLMFVGLNPSTADEFKNDPTVRRVMGFARQWKYDGLVMMNIFAYRATDPKVMKTVVDPVGPENDAWLLKMAGATIMQGCPIIAGWGAHGVHLRRDSVVIELLSEFDLYCLGKTKGGYPKHPLYLRSDTTIGMFSSKGKVV